MAAAMVLLPLARFNKSLKRRTSLFGKNDILPILGLQEKRGSVLLIEPPQKKGDRKALSYFERLPEDAVLALLSHLELPDLLSMSMVCRSIYGLSCSMSLWRDHAFHMFYEQAQILAIDYFVKPAAMTPADLKRAVLRTDRLRRNWSRDHPVSIIPRSSTRLGLALREFHKTEWFFISDRYLVMPAYGTHLLGWDIIENRSMGEFCLDAGAELIHMCSEPTTKALFALFRVESDDEPQTKVRVVEMLFSDYGGTGAVEFIDRASFRLPTSFYLYRQALDAKKRTVCTLFQQEKTDSLKIHVLFDWERPESYVIDTEMHYEPYITILDLWLSDDRNDISVYTETDGSCIEKRFSLERLKSHYFARGSSSTSRRLDSDVLVSSSPFSMELSPESRLLPMGNKHLFFTFRWLGGRLFDELSPAYTPFYRCYITTYLDRAPETSDPVWTLAQYYVPDSEDRQRQRAAPIRRCIITMQDPVLALYGSSGLGQPITDYTFNNVGWIDQIEVPRKITGTRKKRVVRIATFPPPSARASEATCEAKVVTLDIPDEILASACHLIIEPSICAVLIPTENKGKNEIHRFSYA